jgi:hypothetical protein
VLSHNIKTVTSLLLIILSSFSFSQTIYVSPAGLDDNPGTIEKPIKSFQGAVDKLKSSGGKGTVIFRGGDYYFDETIILNKDVCQGKISFEAFPGEKPIFTSGKKISIWKKISPDDPQYKHLPNEARGNVYVADLPENSGIVRFAIDRNSDWLEMGKINVTDIVTTEKFVHGTSVEGQMWDPPDEKKICTFSKSLEDLSNADTALIFSIYTADFELLILPVAEIDGITLITTTPGGHRLSLPEEGQTHDSGDLAFIHNLVEGIDGPGKFATYPQTGKIYLWPQKSTENIYIPLLDELIRIESLPEGRNAWFDTAEINPIMDVTFDGITFMNGKLPIWKDRDVTMQHDWGLIDKDNALLRFRGVENCVIRNCTFSKSGGAGIAFDLYAKNNLVENNLFKFLGFEAIRFAGYGIGLKDENKFNIVRGNEIHHVSENHLYSAAVSIWNSGFNTIEDNYIHHFGSRAVLISSPRNRAFTKNNQKYFPPDRTMREQAWPMARWFEVPEEALHTVKMNQRGYRHVGTRGDNDEGPNHLKGDAIASHYRYTRGNMIKRNVIANGAEKLFADGIYYVTACASGEPNKIVENYIFNTGVGLAYANIPFRLLYVDGFTGPFIFKRNFTYDSKFKFEVIAPYSWWGDVTNQANLFYEVQGADEEYFGNRPSEGNICIGNGPNNPDIKFNTDYEKMIHLLQDYEWNYPGDLPGSGKLNATLKQVIRDLKE